MVACPVRLQSHLKERKCRDEFEKGVANHGYPEMPAVDEMQKGSEGGRAGQLVCCEGKVPNYEWT